MASTPLSPQAQPSFASSSPTFHPNMPTMSTSMRRTSSRSTPSISTIPEDEVLGSDCFSQSTTVEDSFDINQDIKSSLTDLLNCEAVRRDSKMRLWVQTRLMEAEKEMKRQKRKQRSSSTPMIVLTPTEDSGRRGRS